MRGNAEWRPWVIGLVGVAALLTVVALVVGTGAEAAAASLSVLISASAGLLRRRGGRPARHVGRGTARGRRVLGFFLLFWLGAQLSGSPAFLFIRQVTGRPPAEIALMDPAGDLAFVGQDAGFHASIFLLIAGIMAGLDPAGGFPRPTRLDFRAPDACCGRCSPRPSAGDCCGGPPSGCRWRS
ncbi:hypothetical protein AB0K92_30215 [Streptomyces sp. NPDC052687]|uniref:hypothetical protein n=1 Tax=Streptomyces sp. NPDC052687 TaxID=3154759 RepID=UPI003413BB04